MSYFSFEFCLVVILTLSYHGILAEFTYTLEYVLYT